MKYAKKGYYLKLPFLDEHKNKNYLWMSKAFHKSNLSFIVLNRALVSVSKYIQIN